MFTDKSDAALIMLVQGWINDLVNAGMTYSRISSRLNFSPSTIQKIVKKQRKPRLKTLRSIAGYFIKIFKNPEKCG